MKNKKAFELQFSWIFAVIVGAVVFFLMLYFVTKIIGTGSYERATEWTAELTSFLEPLGTTNEVTKIPPKIEFPYETRLYNRCFSSGIFGKQELAMSVKSFGKWQEKGAEIPVKSHYVFSDKIEEGKNFYSFSKPFDMPFKIADLIFLSTKSYCFVKPPESIEDEIQESGLRHIKIDNCSSQDIKACFDSKAGCDISVYGTCYNCEDKFELGYVLKDREQLYYANSLLYAAIISDKEIYECNVKRLMSRASQLALLYKDKAEFLGEKCNPDITIDMALFSGSTENASMENLQTIKEFAKTIETKNNAAICEIF